MANQNKKIKAKQPNVSKSPKKYSDELDGIFVLKVVMYFLLGCLWVSFGGNNGLSLPVGLLIGIVFASHDHFQIDRKIEYVMLIIATILSYVTPIGFILQIN